MIRTANGTTKPRETTAAWPGSTASPSGSAAGPQASEILVTRGPSEGLALEVGHHLVIGRAPGSDLLLQDASVSRRHARIVRDDDTYRIQDLGSRNGTLVNGKPVRISPLSHGDLIQIGRIELRFHLRETAAAPGPRVSRISAIGRRRV